MDVTKDDNGLFTKVDFIRQWIIKADIILHIIAGVLLLIACTFILFRGLTHLFDPSIQNIIHMVNEVLLSLIVLELLWTVLRFLKKQKFILAPFLAIGIIACIRRILLIEAQSSYMDHVPEEKLIELGLCAVIIIILMVAYYLSVKADKIETENEMAK